MADDFLDVLARKFAAEDGSFLLTLRSDLVWNQEAFTRLTEAMLACCQAYDLSTTHLTLWGERFHKQELPRWLAEGFWYIAHFVKAHSSHPNFPRRYDTAYYEADHQRLWDLAEWFFSGHSPYQPGHGFDPR